MSKVEKLQSIKAFKNELEVKIFEMKLFSIQISLASFPALLSSHKVNSQTKFDAFHR